MKENIDQVLFQEDIPLKMAKLWAKLSKNCKKKYSVSVKNLTVNDVSVNTIAKDVSFIAALDQIKIRANNSAEKISYGYSGKVLIKLCNNLDRIYKDTYKLPKISVYHNDREIFRYEIHR